MPLTEMIVTVTIAGAMALIAISLLGLVATLIRHRTLRKAVETNPELAEGLLEKLTVQRENSGDDRLAVILVAIGLAIAGASIVIGDAGIMRFGIAAALFPLLVGGALWLRSRAAERAKRRDRADG